MKTIVAIYILTMVLANYSASYFGPSVTPINSLIFVGINLTVRDILAVRLSKYLVLLLMTLSGIASYALNPATGQIAIASIVAYSLATLVDWYVFYKVKGDFVARSTKSNVVSSLTDSLVFPTVAFGSIMPEIMALQFAAKIVGGFIFAKFYTGFNKENEE